MEHSGPHYSHEAILKIRGRSIIKSKNTYFIFLSRALETWLSQLASYDISDFKLFRNLLDYIRQYSASSM